MKQELTPDQRAAQAEQQLFDQRAAMAEMKAQHDGTIERCAQLAAQVANWKRSHAVLEAHIKTQDENLTAITADLEAANKRLAEIDAADNAKKPSVPEVPPSEF